MRRIRLGEDVFWTIPAIAADLRALGLAAGDAVMVHASLRRVGPVLGGADGVIAALGDVVGPQGCILAYVSWLEQFEDALGPDGRLDPALKPFIPPFDPATSRANPDHGWLAEALRTTPGARRSGNPGASVAALGAGALIGVSCYADLARAQRLAAQGADYLAFGAFHASPTKPAAGVAGVGLLAAARPLGLPLVAIGGITPDNGGALVRAGAFRCWLERSRMGRYVHALWSQPDSPWSWHWRDTCRARLPHTSYLALGRRR